MDGETRHPRDRTQQRSRPYVEATDGWGPARALTREASGAHHAGATLSAPAGMAINATGQHGGAVHAAGPRALEPDQWPPLCYSSAALLVPMPALNLPANRDSEDRFESLEKKKEIIFLDKIWAKISYSYLFICVVQSIWKLCTLIYRWMIV